MKFSFIKGVRSPKPRNGANRKRRKSGKGSKEFWKRKKRIRRGRDISKLKNSSDYSLGKIR